MRDETSEHGVEQIVDEVLPEPVISTTPQTPRLHFVDGLRAFAALWVLAFHCWTFSFAPRSGQPGWMALPLSAGHLGVPIFLVLSGFCLALPYVSKGTAAIDLRQFSIRRAVRILPPYWICTIVFATLSLVQARTGALGVKSVQQVTDGNDLVWHLALIHNLSANHFFRINGALWSVALECQLYIVFPLLMLFAAKPVRVLAPCALVSASAWFYASTKGFDPATAAGMVVWASPLSYLLVFALGMAGAVWFKHDRDDGNMWSGVAIVALVLAALADHAYASFPIAAVLLAAFAAVSALLAGGGSPTGKLLELPLLVKIGWVSYTLYLIHNPIVSFAGKLLRPRLHGAALVFGMLVAAGVAVVLAMLLFPVLEQPFHRLAKRLAARQQPA